MLRHAELLEVCAHRFGRDPDSRSDATVAPSARFESLRPSSPRIEAVVDELRRRRAERLEEPPVHRLVRTVVVAADDVRDAEIDVVDDRRELVRRRAVLAQERDALEPVAERRADLAMAVGALALAHRPLVPRDAEPLEVGDDRLLPALDVPRRIGVVDAEKHPVAEAAVRDRAERVADVKRARRTGSEANPNHAASV